MHLIVAYSKLSKEHKKSGIEILVRQAVLKLWIKTVKLLFGSITRELFGLHKFLCYFWVSWTIYCTMHLLFFRIKGVDNFEIEHESC